MVDALDPSQIFDELDAIHAEVESVVADTRPSQVLAGLQTNLEQVQNILSSLSLRDTFGPPITAAWDASVGVLGEVDFRVVLSPLVDKLDELETEFLAGLSRVEDAFDDMLGAASGALGEDVTASVSAG